MYLLNYIINISDKNADQDKKVYLLSDNLQF